MMKIGLCLSGGALRAAAHIGAIRALEELGVEIAAVSGSSAGALVALLYAAGWESGRMAEFLRSLRRRDLFRLSRDPGLFSLRGVEEMLRRELGDLDPGEWKRPCRIWLTRLEDGVGVLAPGKDPVADALASCSLSPIFSPRRLEGVEYIDGGFSDNLPVDPLLEEGYRVLAINVNPLEEEMPRGFGSLMLRSVMIMLNSTTHVSRERSDAYLEIRGVAGMHLFEFSKVEEALEAGYREMLRAWPELAQRLGNPPVL